MGEAQRATASGHAAALAYIGSAELCWGRAGVHMHNAPSRPATA